ncbi:MAG: ribosome-associated translation inhibitor RaiA [Eubacteriales bacterium]|nr:ribosome-associated translation inhibitor RaiA [Eubacteriales bacterium]MDD3290405.1 ribosome-associated translation inhibitor RaiA [Eubacteriales bacterium]MDD3863413.1 ribosome-associated translation inhibitor RaiA [Eubacteriales bacterium]MDD4445315.1 ribosome-associated translation inhibitor RaiA [Eubacteriales bacterium]
MKVIITTKNFNASDQLKERIEKKFQKLDKYFSKEIVANIMLSSEKENLQKLEATINAGGMIFRAEEKNTDIYNCLDKVIDRLSSQMSRFKTKMVKRHKDQKEVLFSEVPDLQEATEEITVVKTKHFAIHPMSTEEAIMQMELLEHSFFVFLNEEAADVNVVYKRKDGSYGLLITEK